VSRPVSAESFIADVLASQEFRDGLRTRLVNGTAKIAELEIAKRLGLAAGADPEEDERREAMRSMPRETRRTLMQIIRMSMSADAGELRLIQAGDWTGIGYSLSVRARAEAEARRGKGPMATWKKPTDLVVSQDTDDADLMPKRTP